MKLLSPSLTLPRHAEAAPATITATTSLTRDVRVPLKARVVFFRQWATCIQSGMSMGAALEHLAQETRQPELREAARKARICVEGGGRLSAWMRTRPQVFSGAEGAFIHVGEVSGALDTVLDRIATDLETEQALRRRLFLATFINKYFVLPLLFLVPNTPNIMMHGLDSLMQHDNSLSVGEQQRIMLREGLRGYAHDLVTQMIPVMLGVAIAWLAWHLFIRTMPGRRVRDRVLLLTPLTGPLRRDQAVSRYLTALQLLSQAGVTPATALESCAYISGNVILDAKFADAARLAREHQLSIPDALSQVGILSGSTLDLLRTGHQTGSMPEMLDRSVRYYQSDLGNRLGYVPIVVGVLCFLVFGVATAIVVGRAVMLYVNNLSPAVDKFMGIS